jgi:hypothetical protein
MRSFMMYRLVIIFFIILSLGSCEDKNLENKQRNNDTAIKIQKESDTLISRINTEQEKFSDDTTIIDAEFSFINAVFDYGASQHLNECNFYFECDCCSGNLIFYKDSAFYYVDHCIGNLTITRGHFSIHENKLICISDGIRVDKEYDPSKEYNPNIDEFQLTDTITEPYKMLFEIQSCNNKPQLVDRSNEEIWIAAYTDLNADREIKKLYKDGIMDRFKQKE